MPRHHPLLSLGHGDPESGGLRMEVDNSGIIFTNSYVNFSSAMKNSFLTTAKISKSTLVLWTDVHESLNNGKLMVATRFRTPHNLTIINVLPPQHVSNFSRSCGDIHTTLNSMESIEFNGWGRLTDILSCSSHRLV